MMLTGNEQALEDLRNQRQNVKQCLQLIESSVDMDEYELVPHMLIMLHDYVNLAQGAWWEYCEAFDADD
jgi:hypothetical protein